MALDVVAYVLAQKANKRIDEVEIDVAGAPYIGTNGHWYSWDVENNVFVDTGVAANGILNLNTTTATTVGTTAQLISSIQSLNLNNIALWGTVINQ